MPWPLLYKIAELAAFTPAAAVLKGLLSELPGLVFAHIIGVANVHGYGLVIMTEAHQKEAARYKSAVILPGPVRRAEGEGPARALIHGRQAARIAAGVAEKLQGAVHALAYQHEVRGVYGPQQQEYQPGDGCHGGGDESAL